MNGLERRRITAAIPWVTRTPESHACIGWRSDTPLKAVYSMGGKPPVGLDNYRCRMKARWHFEALPGDHLGCCVRTGYYCMNHLFARCLYANPDEEARLNAWLEEQGL